MSDDQQSLKKLVREVFPSSGCNYVLCVCMCVFVLISVYDCTYKCMTVGLPVCVVVRLRVIGASSCRVKDVSLL